MDREADVTVSETDRLHSQLARFEDMFRGYRMEIVEGNIVMSPLKPHHAQTIRRVWNALEAQLSDEWGFLSDVAIPLDQDNANPGPDGYLGRDTIPYGKTVTVETGIGQLTVDTSTLPVDPGVGA
ncbi:hypothetical protein [Streptomyces sp. NPDC051921]|uniref:hypothetical protein n=1 Tax=Streptomyces sp. NPDC051921 TaxID=3155806 RepID=UPI003431C2ED